MKTYATLYQNEIRAVELTVRDQDDADYNPTEAYAWVLNHDGDIIQTESVCMVTGNRVYALIGEGVTGIAGDYDIVWKIIKRASEETTYRFFHKTKLTVEEL
jgi:hypothetical protein